MAKLTPAVNRLRRCPLRFRDDVPRHMVWRDEPHSWVVAFGTPREWVLIASGISCWHFAQDCVTRWHRDPADPDDRGGWLSPVFRPNGGLELPGGELVCGICYGDLTGSPQ
jgi:hypothetical protein